MGFDSVDENFLNLINSLMLFFKKYYSGLITAGQAIGAIMAIFVVAGEAYKVMVQHKGFDILAILRPVAIAMVLSQWLFFVDMIGAIPRTLESYAQSIFQTEHASIKDLREARTKAAADVKERTQKAKAAADIVEKQISSSLWDKLSEWGTDFLDNIKEQLFSFLTLWEAQVNSFLEEWVMKIGEFFWQIQIYLLFFIKEVFAGILIMTGPITFGLSVIPAWKDAWVQWIARYVSVLLYGFVGFFFLAAALQMVKYGIKCDISVLTAANSTQEAFTAYSKSSMITALYTFVTLIVGGLAMRLVPEISSWIIPSTAGYAAKEFVSGTYNSLKSGARSAASLATGGK